MSARLVQGKRRIPWACEVDRVVQCLLSKLFKTAGCRYPRRLNMSFKLFSVWAKTQLYSKECHLNVSISYAIASAWQKIPLAEDPIDITVAVMKWGSP